MGKLLTMNNYLLLFDVWDEMGRMEKQETENGNGHGKRKRTWKAETDVENGKIVRMLRNC